MKTMMEIAFDEQLNDDDIDAFRDDLNNELTVDVLEKSLNVSRPTPPIGSFGAIDPGVIQVAVTLAGGGGIFAVFIRGLLRIVEKKVENRRIKATVKINGNELTLDGQLSPEELRNQINDFLSRIQPENDQR